MNDLINVVRIADVPVERMQERDGWSISEFRLPISGATGSDTTMFHATFESGAVHSKHIHHNCDEIVAYVHGAGVAGQGDGRGEIVGGHRRHIPRGTEHFFANESDEPALVLGFYVGASSVADTGYEHRGDVDASDVARPLGGFDHGTVVHVDDVEHLEVNNVPGWSAARVKLSIGRSTGHGDALIDVELPPGASIDRQTMGRADQLYLVTAGSGTLESAHRSFDLEEGCAVRIPRGCEFAVVNTDSEACLTFVGLLVGAGGLGEDSRIGRS